MYWWHDLPRYALDPTTKVGRGYCSASGCEERCQWVLRYAGRWWGTCPDHLYKLNDKPIELTLRKPKRSWTFVDFMNGELGGH